MDRLLIWIGLVMVALGVLVVALGALLGVFGARGGRLLPGDIVVSRPGFTFVFPLATSILVSLLHADPLGGIGSAAIGLLLHVRRT